MVRSDRGKETVEDVTVPWKKLAGHWTWALPEEEGYNGNPLGRRLDRHQELEGEEANQIKAATNETVHPDLADGTRSKS